MDAGVALRACGHERRHCRVALDPFFFVPPVAAQAQKRLLLLEQVVRNGAVRVVAY